MKKRPGINKYILVCYLMTFACGFGSSATQFVKLDMRLYLGLSNTLFATLATVNLIVSLVVTLGLSNILDTKDNKKLIVTGLSIQLIGLVTGIFISNPVMVVISNVFSGFGYSIASSAAYPAFMMIDPDNVTTHVNREQGALTFGAFVSPLIMAVLINTLGITWRIAYIIYACTSASLLIFALTQKSPGVPEKHFEDKTDESTESTKEGKKKIFSPYFISVAAALTLYMIMEAGVLMYSKDYFTLNLDYVVGASLCISAIRGGMTISRMYGDKVFKDKIKLSLISMILTAASVFILSFSKINFLSLIAIFLFGIFSGAVWPTVFSMGLVTDKSISGKLTSILLVCNTIGNNLGNLMTGAIIDNTSIPTAFFVSGVVGILCILAILLASRFGKKQGISRTN
ncbi:MAG: MFS transporter [Clostridia bacterium]|nr:MFS transporter [Clostridia bacterium]